jgi:hypothetical protein
MAIGVTFWNEYNKNWRGKVYTYHCSINDINIGDLCVVDARGEPKVVRVAELGIADNDERITYKQVRCKLPPLLPNTFNPSIDEEERLRNQIARDYALEAVDPNA